jgi:phosphotransferase system HPr (HPr) family protein
MLSVLQLVRRFEAQVEIVKDGQRASAADMLHMVGLASDPGQQLVLEATGPQAKEALDALVDLFAAGFHEDET